MLLNFIQALKSPADKTGQTEHEDRELKFDKKTRPSCFESSGTHRISQSYF